MALPPRPLDERLADADIVIDADAIDVPPVAPQRADGTRPRDDVVDQGLVYDEQLVRVTVRRVLRGTEPALSGGELTVRKPFGPLAIGDGFEGILLLRSTTGPPEVIDALARGSGQATTVVEQLG